MSILIARIMVRICDFGIAICIGGMIYLAIQVTSGHFATPTCMN